MKLFVYSLIWFANKSELSSHSCLMELNITGSHIYCCHFCATVSDDLDQLRPHVAQVCIILTEFFIHNHFIIIFWRVFSLFLLPVQKIQFGTVKMFLQIWICQNFNSWLIQVISHNYTNQIISKQKSRQVRENWIIHLQFHENFVW